MKIRVTLIFLCSVLSQIGLAKSVPSRDGLISIPEGKYVAFYFSDSKPSSIAVDAFQLDRHAVTRADFLAFVKEHSAWRKSRVKQLFADSHYLEDWKDDFAFTQDSSAPVTFVSWFAATAYCEAHGEALPTTDQWEYVAADAGRRSAATNDRILEWYGKPDAKRLSVVESTPRNGFGVFDLHGLIWEWTSDFNSAIGDGDDGAFCAAGSQGARDSTDYASFMRFSFRSSLQANYSVGNLGFRCAQEVGK